jgi:hypothetical protein
MSFGLDSATVDAQIAVCVSGCVVATLHGAGFQSQRA